MAGTVDDHHRNLGRNPVELLTRRRPLFGELLRLVTEANDPSPRRHLLNLALHPRDQIRNVLRAEQVGIDEVLSEIDHVAVGVDEAGEDGVAGEIDPTCRRRGELINVGLAPHGEDRSILHGQRLGVLRGLTTHREDRAAGVDRVGGSRAGHERGDEASENDHGRDTRTNAEEHGRTPGGR
jgi:hypothetical protein